MKKNEKSTEILDCYNIAGQAVAFLASGKAVRHLTIQGRGKQRCNVHRCQRENIVDPDHRRSIVEIEIVAAFCGQIAVDAFSHAAKPVFDVNSLDRSVYDAVRCVCGSDHEADAMLFWLWCRAENVYFGDGVWFAIGNIASELVKSRTIDGKRLKILYDQALLQAK